MTDQTTEERRQRYAAAAKEAGDTAYGHRPFYEAITDAVMAVADAEQAELRARVATLEHVAKGNKRHVQHLVPELERAEAALARVRAVADSLADGTEAGFRAALAVREALDPQ